MDWGLILTIGAVVVAGLAAVVGLWMERDPHRPPRWAWSLTVLILVTTIVTLVTSYNDKLENDARDAAATVRYDDLKKRSTLLQQGNDRLEEAAEEAKDREGKMQDDIARMLVKLNAMAKTSTDPAVQELVKSEIAAQSRANDAVVGKIAQQVKDSGEDPETVLAAVLPQEELQRVKRNLKEKEERMDALLDKKEKRKKDREAREEGDDKGKKGKKRDRDDEDDKDRRDKKDRDKDKPADSEKPAASAAPPAPSGSALTAPPAPSGSVKAAQPKKEKKDKAPKPPKAP